MTSPRPSGVLIPSPSSPTSSHAPSLPAMTLNVEVAGRSSGRHGNRCTVGCGSTATAASGCAKCGSPTVKPAYGSAPSLLRRWPALHGESTKLNFPDYTHALPRASTTSLDDIQCTAVVAAEMYRPDSSLVSLPPPKNLCAICWEESGQGSRGPVRGFVNEEGLFNMPGLVDSMVEGLLLTPPAMRKEFDWDGAECHVDLSVRGD